MKELEDNKEQIINDLNTIAYLLNRYSLCNNTKPLYDAIGQCNHKSTSDYWVYNIDKLCFDIEPQSHTLPQKASLLQLIFSIKIEGKYISNTIPNPTTSLTLDIEINGLDEDSNSLHCAWHLDKHIGDASDGPTKYYHPEYHIAFGGMKMLNTGYNYGSTLVLPSPRLPHPPLDGILGIDFVIQNYIRYDIHCKMTKSNEYKKLLSRAQLRVWKPFFLSIASFWSDDMTGFKSELLAHQILPNIA